MEGEVFRISSDCGFLRDQRRDAATNFSSDFQHFEPLLLITDMFSEHMFDEHTLKRIS